MPKSALVSTQKRRESGGTPLRHFVNRVVDRLVIGLASVLLYGLFRFRPPMVAVPFQVRFLHGAVASFHAVHLVCCRTRKTVHILGAFLPLMQYLLLAWRAQLKQRLDQRHLVPSRRFVWRGSARWMAINVVAGYTMFWLMPRIGSQFGRSMAFSTAIVLAVLQLHHFFVDGVLPRRQR